MERIPERTQALLLFLVSLAVRAVFVLTLPAGTLPGGFTFPDEQEYFRVIGNFLGGQGLIVHGTMKAFRPPLFPLLASSAWWTGAGMAGVRGAQVVLSALTVLLIRRLGKRLFSPAAGTAAGAIAAIYPFFIYYTAFLLTETLFIFLVVLTVLLFVETAGEPSARRAWAAGACLGLAGLCRPAMELYLPCALVLLVTLRQPLRLRLRKAFAAAAAFTIVLAPWVLRNAVVLRSFVPGTTMGGWVLWEGNNPASDGGPCSSFPPGVHQMGEIERDRFLTRSAVAAIRADPGRFRWLLRNKFIRYWNVVPNFAGFRSLKYRLVSVLSYGLLLPFFALGFLVTLRDPHARFLHALILLFTAFHMVWLASIRYRTPPEPFTILLAVRGITWLGDEVRRAFR